jgi:DegV family protein with EDD domain
VTIRIASDRTCDLPQTVVDQFGIGIVPCYINIGNASYLDGVDLSRQDFYEQLPYYSPHPKTAAPGVGMYSEIYQRLADEGADQVISIHIHSGLSNLSNTARLAAKTAEKFRVTVVEAGQLTLGLGFMVIAAAEAARKGRSLAEILHMLKEQENRTFVYAAFNSLDYLRASGRASDIVVRIAKLLHIKPIIQLHRGELRLIGQERTLARSMDHLVDQASKFGRIEKLAVLHSNAVDKARILADKLKSRISYKLDIWTTEITPVLGVHIGPGAVGLACVTAE